MKKILLSITLAFILVVSTFAIDCDAGVSACMDSNPFSYENDMEGPGLGLYVY